VQLIAIGYDASFVYPGLAGGLFATFKDAVEVVVLLAVGYGFWRASSRSRGGSSRTARPS